VLASAALERVEGRRLTFNVTVTDRCGLVAAGRVTRVLVQQAAFMDKAR
jgi:predicted thioesterase